MYKKFFRILSVVTCVGISFSAVAVEYTAKHSKASKAAAKQADKNECSKKDLRAIKKFDRKGKKAIEEWHEMNSFSEKIVRGTTGLSTKEIIKIAKDPDIYDNFFMSNKYMAMKAVYKRCDKDMPAIKPPAMYWMPVSLQGALDTEAASE